MYHIFSDFETESGLIPVVETQQSVESTSSSSVLSPLPISTPSRACTANKENLTSIIGPYPFEAPNGFQWIPKWELVPVTAPESSPGPSNVSTPNRSFEKLFLERVKPSLPSQKKKRVKLDMKAQVSHS